MSAASRAGAPAGLPVPDDGWARLALRVAVVAALWAIAAFVLAAAGLPVLDPECRSDSPTSGPVCPLERDPALTHLFDARWPLVPVPVTVSAVLAAVFLGIRLATRWDASEHWSAPPDAPSFLFGLTGLTGAALGLLLAGPGFVQPAVAIAITGIGALLALLGLLGLRAFFRALRRRYARHLADDGPGPGHRGRTGRTDERDEP